MRGDLEMHSRYKEETSEGKLILLWILASLLFFSGAWIAGHVERVFGSTPFSFYFSIFLSISLFLAGAFLVIVISVSVAQSR